MENWKDIPGYIDLQASDMGNVRRLQKDGSYRVLKAHLAKSKNRNRNQYRIRYCNNRKYKDLSLPRLIYVTFNGSIPCGHIVVHKNGLHDDNEPCNLITIKRTDSGRLYGAAGKQRPVKKLDRYGKEVGYYPSATAAAKDAPLCIQSVTNNCNEMPRKVAADGFIYRWD